MRVQTEEWRRFIPGVRMYKGKLTYFYNGEKLYENETDEYLIYNLAERQTWEVIMVLPGVEIIPEGAFSNCINVKTVIMSDTVRQIEDHAFWYCKCLVFIQLSKNIEFIRRRAFAYCVSLTSIFIPESCREIHREAFLGCTKLIIFNVSRNTTLGEYVICNTALIKASHFETDEYGNYDIAINNEVNEWIKNLNQPEEYALHRECASIEPSEDIIYEMIMRQGLPSVRVKNEIGLTALEYLQQNPYTDITEQKLIKRLVLDLMGEIIPSFA